MSKWLKLWSGGVHFTGGYPMTLASSWLISPRNSKGNIGSGGAEWDTGRKNTQFSANKVGASNDSVVDENSIFADFGGYFFWIIRGKASNIIRRCNIIWRYATPCRPMIDRKMNDLEWLFHVKLFSCQQFQIQIHGVQISKIIAWKVTNYHTIIPISLLSAAEM